MTRSRARTAARRLRAIGVNNVHGQPLLGVTAPVEVRVLGGFAVYTAGGLVPFAAWRSRQARTLVKVLASRRGRPVRRAELCEILWPDHDPARTSHRLSVLLATVRAVLDPARTRDTDHFVAADSTGIWLDLRHVFLDAELLISDAAEASHLMARGDVDTAEEIFRDIDSRRGGPALEEESEEPWAASLRAETRAAWTQTLRHRTTLAKRDGRRSEACSLLGRLLLEDPYDEQVHRGLVRSLLQSGRRGDAWLAFQAWDEAMTALDAPRPDPTILGLLAPDAAR